MNVPGLSFIYTIIKDYFAREKKKKTPVPREVNIEYANQLKLFDEWKQKGYELRCVNRLNIELNKTIDYFRVFVVVSIQFVV